MLRRTLALPALAMQRALWLCATAAAITRTSVDVGRGLSVLLDQHYFDTPVVQPRVGRVADRSGLRLWPCAKPLLQYLSETTVPALEAALGRKPRIVELGSGVGLLGIGLALATGCEVTLTDPGLDTRFSEDGEEMSTLDFLRGNVALNAAPARAEKCLWGDAEDLAALGADFDLVVASDVLYEPSQYPALADTLAHFGADALVGYPKRHGREAAFLEMMRERGFAAECEPLEAKLAKEAVLARFERPR